VHVLCPEISWFEWHPFSVANWPALGTGFVRLLVNTKGDWTRQLHRRCEEKPDDLPKVKLDGPFCAPAQSIKADVTTLTKETAPKRSLTKKWWNRRSVSTRDLDYASDIDEEAEDDIEQGPLGVSSALQPDCGCSQDDVIVCIGAGVGITPFLSSLDAMLKKAAAHKVSGEQAEIGRSKKVWFYWLTRNAGDFLSGVSILRQLSAAATKALLTGDTGLVGLTEVHLRLHVTAAVGPLQLQKPSTFLFHESLSKVICLQMATARTPSDEDTKQAFMCDIPTGSSVLHDSYTADSDDSATAREGPSSSIPIRFGRPCWPQDFVKIAFSDRCPLHQGHIASAPAPVQAPTKWVYLCGNTRLQADVADACRWASNETGHKFSGSWVVDSGMCHNNILSHYPQLLMTLTKQWPSRHHQRAVASWPLLLAFTIIATVPCCGVSRKSHTADLTGSGGNLVERAMLDPIYLQQE
ncbi:NADPH oxidase 1, partial [Perkinsus olseni]